MRCALVASTFQARTQHQPPTPALNVGSCGGKKPALANRFFYGALPRKQSAVRTERLTNVLVRRAVKFQKRCWLILGPSSRLTSVLDVGRGWCLWARAHCILLRKQHLAFAIRPLMHQQNHTLPSQHKLYRPLLRQETRHLRTTLPHLRAMQDTRSLRAGGALTRCSARANIATRDWGRDMGLRGRDVGGGDAGTGTGRFRVGTRVFCFSFSLLG